MSARSRLVWCFITFCHSPFLIAQTPGITWQRSIGGNDSEGPDDLIPPKMLTTKTGDVLCLGVTGSKNGDNPMIGYQDVILACYSKEGVKKWSKNYGHPYALASLGGISETADGGFIIVYNLMGYLKDPFYPDAPTVCILR